MYRYVYTKLYGTFPQDAKIHDVSNYSQMSLDSLQDSNRLGNAVDDVTEEVKRAAAQTLHQVSQNMMSSYQNVQKNKRERGFYFVFLPMTID